MASAWPEAEHRTSIKSVYANVPVSRSGVGCILFGLFEASLKRVTHFPVTVFIPYPTGAG